MYNPMQIFARSYIYYKMPIFIHFMRKSDIVFQRQTRNIFNEPRNSIAAQAILHSNSRKYAPIN